MSALGNNRTSRHALTAILFLAFAAIIVYGIYDAIRLSWMCDDAFISFRYAKNLVNGLGLVYNAGEWVDGYTNFLWTLIMALGLRYGIDPVKLSQVLGILSYALTVLTFLLLSAKITREDGSSYLYFPLTALCLSLHHDQHLYATSGLETSFFVFLISVGFCAILMARGRASCLLAGLLLTLTMLTRPDGMIFSAMSLLYLLLVMKGRRSTIFYYLLPFILIYLPYWIWHLFYYGYPFPNTYYAKSAHLPYYSQGLRYITLYLKTYYVLLAVPLLLLIYASMIVVRFVRTRPFRDRVSGSAVSKQFSQRVILLALLFVAAFVFYIVRLGGDFMFARFLLPATPFLFLLIECLVNRIFRRRIRVVVMVLILALTFCRKSQFRLMPEEGRRREGIQQALNKHIPPLRGVIDKTFQLIGPTHDRKDTEGITYEPFFYPKGIVGETKVMGERMKDYFKDLPIVVGFLRCMLVYYADFPVAIEIATGLTDKHIAHMPLKERSRPGHEKGSPADYLRKRKMNFTFCSVMDKIGYLGNYDIMSIHGMGGSIFIYDNAVMQELRKHKDIRFVHFPSYLDNYIKRMELFNREKVRADYKKFKLYYFDYNDDPKREKAFKEFLEIDTIETKEKSSLVR